MFQDFWQGALEVVFPDNCLLCRQFLNSRHKRQLCSHCLGLLEPNTAIFSRPGGPPLAYDQAWSACFYNAGTQKLLHIFKYGGKTSLRKTFVPLMADFVERHHIPFAQFDMIIPIPLHPVRWRERGYNQAALLSEGLGRHFGLPHKPQGLARTRATRTQTELDAKQRWTNMEGAFRIKNPSDIEGKTIILVDDLYTTGATVHWAAEALKQAGALRVGVLTFAVTV
jgi:competence protein ComFC